MNLPTDASRLILPGGVLHPFLSVSQRLALNSALHGEEGSYFAETLIELAAQIQAMPSTYEQDGLGDQAVAHLHYFQGGMDFWITEKDMDGGVTQAFGLACTTGDISDAEIGYISITEITRAGTEIDLHWEPKTLAEIRGRVPAPTVRTLRVDQNTESPSP